MFKLSFIILALLLTINVLAIQSPHGNTLSTKCDVCHTTGGWTKIKTDSFNHDQTGFPLVGQHQTVKCKSCHTDLVFSTAKKDCNACHKDVHQGTVGQDCKRCHKESSWVVSNISQIHEQTRFPLRDSHKQVDCNKCHKSASLLRFDPMKSECVDCHLADYNSNPTHVSNNFSKECVLCHTGKNWQSSTFDHNTTSFPLTGRHQTVECKKCHQNGYLNTSSECVSCHLANYNATTKPNHLLAKISTDCKECHNTNDWLPAKFNHDINTSFPLTGGHKGLDCIKCHASGYNNTSTECVSCHKKNFDATINPNHVTAKFSTDCQTCHNVTAWQPSTFNHNTNTSFPLTGGHVGVDCIKCHANGYANTSTTCVSCHKANALATTNPNHTAANFLTACESCHTTSGWTPTKYVHPTTFKLTGGHGGLTCNNCHAKGYAGTSTTCVSCHLADYNATKSPAHASSSFSTNCVTCHTTIAWVPSTFNHETYFPIKTGKHTGISCVECHNNVGNYKVFTCTNCHEHNKTDMDKEHKGESGYVWNSTNCYNCHPRGKS